jgi:hypothetical protein
MNVVRRMWRKAEDGGSVCRPVEDTLYARYTAFENTPALSTEGAFTSFL